MRPYRTVMKAAEAERVIEKSKFIANVIPCESRESALTFFNDIRNRYKDATHNVPAMVIGDKSEIQWGSDDGEPQGTAGAPIVRMMVAQDICNVALVVTRYFGGIKLGTGGLIRAYTATAEDVIKAATLCDVEERVVMEGILDYKTFNKLSSVRFEDDEQIRNVRYTDQVRFEVACRKEREGFCREIINGIAMNEKWIISRGFESVKIPISGE